MRSLPANQHQKPAQVTEIDRLSFAFFVALALHAFVILGLGFSSYDNLSKPSMLEVNLSHNSDDEIPDDADYLSQNNQIGSGTLEEKAKISSNEKSVYQDNVVQKIQMQRPSVIRSDKSNLKKIVVTNENAIYLSPTKNKKHFDNPDLEKSNERLLQKLTKEIASLDAQLSQQNQIHAKGPKTRQISALSTKSSDDAAYINSFREKIEYIGNKYYPREAKEKNMHGKVQLLVAIKKDGSLKEIKVINSSNIPTLDKAAINSVRLAAPFPRFPKSIRKDTDVLEIIRTWRFEEQNYLSNS